MAGSSFLANFGCYSNTSRPRLGPTAGATRVESSHAASVMTSFGRQTRRYARPGAATY